MKILHNKTLQISVSYNYLVFLTSPQVNCVGLFGNYMSYIDPVHMFIFLGPRLKEQSLPGDLMMKDSSPRGQAKPYIWLGFKFSAWMWHISYHIPLIKASHINKPNNNGVGSCLLPEYGGKWVDIYSTLLHSIEMLYHYIP